MKTRPNPQVSFEVTLTLNESEARALDAICGYSPDAFLATFYEKMGRGYLQPYAAGFKSLTEAVREQLTGQLHQVDESRRVLRGERIEDWRNQGAASCLGIIAMAQAIRENYVPRTSPPKGG